MNKIRESEGSSPLLFKTNRQLYSKRKKNLDLSVLVSTDKILKLLVKKN
jgi:hypothetical protein